MKHWNNMITGMPCNGIILRSSLYYASHVYSLPGNHGNKGFYSMSRQQYTITRRLKWHESRQYNEYFILTLFNTFETKLGAHTLVPTSILEFITYLAWIIDIHLCAIFFNK